MSAPGCADGEGVEAGAVVLLLLPQPARATARTRLSVDEDDFMDTYHQRPRLPGYRRSLIRVPGRTASVATMTGAWAAFWQLFLG